MKTLTAEMKAELEAKRIAAEVNARIRTPKPEPKFTAPPKPVRLLPEVPVNYYKGINPVKDWYEVYEYES